MSLTRSASGPGGLSINTGAANLFGNSTSQPPPAGGLFGGGSSTTATTTASQPTLGGSLFGTAPATSKPALSLFGSTTTTPQPQQTGGLFGANPTATTATQAQATPTLFGTSTAASQPQQTGGLFGSTLGQPQQTGGLFGSTTQQQLPQTGGLFSTSTQQQPAQTGGLFGTSTQQQPAQTGGLFGASTQQQVAPSGGLFGMAPSTAMGGLFSAPAQTTTNPFGQTRPAGSVVQESILANQMNQNAGQNMVRSVFGPPHRTPMQGTVPLVPGVRIDSSGIRGTTRFNDLHEDIQKDIARIDKIIEACIAQKGELDAFMPAHGEQLAAIPPDVRFVSRKAAGVEGALGGDAQAVAALRELVRADADHARLSFKAVDNLKLPAPYHTAGLWSARGPSAAAPGAGADGEGDNNSDLVSFFSATADEMADTMRKFQQNLTDIEIHLRGVEGNLREQVGRLAASSKMNGQSGVEERVAELAAVLTEFEGSILQVAGVVGGAREKVTELQLGQFIGNGTNGVR